MGDAPWRSCVPRPSPPHTHRHLMARGLRAEALGEGHDRALGRTVERRRGPGARAIEGPGFTHLEVFCGGVPRGCGWVCVRHRQRLSNTERCARREAKRQAPAPKAMVPAGGAVPKWGYRHDGIMSGPPTSRNM